MDKKAISLFTGAMLTVASLGLGLACSKAEARDTNWVGDKIIHTDRDKYGLTKHSLPIKNRYVVCEWRSVKEVAVQDHMLRLRYDPWYAYQVIAHKRNRFVVDAFYKRKKDSKYGKAGTTYKKRKYITIIHNSRHLITRADRYSCNSRLINQINANMNKAGFRIVKGRK